MNLWKLTPECVREYDHKSKMLCCFTKGLNSQAYGMLYTIKENDQSRLAAVISPGDGQANLSTLDGSMQFYKKIVFQEGRENTSNPEYIKIHYKLFVRKKCVQMAEMIAF